MSRQPLKGTDTLTSWEGEGGELGQEVARPVTLVLAQGEADFFPDTGGQVGVGLGGEALAGLGAGWGQQQAQYLRALEPARKEVGESE